jgi:glycosyltransferase involved in cell wall biosynthesis
MNGIGFVYAFIAKLEKVPVRIVHSHNTDFGSGARGVKEIAHSLGKRFLGKYSTANLASSHAAGSYLFDKHPFTVIKNGIDTVHFRFSEEKRTSVRKQLNLSNTEILIGTVGRLAEAKNPLFQVDILRSLMARGIDAKLLLVGDGPMKGKIIEYSASLGIESKVIIPGASSDPAPYFSALDISTVPSTFEGFGITIIEAMASGLYCLYSDAIPPFEFNIPNQHMIASRSADSWSSEVVHLLPEIKQHPRENDAQLIKNCGYDIDSLSTQLSTIYNN